MFEKTKIKMTLPGVVYPVEYDNYSSGVYDCGMLYTTCIM